MPRSRSLGTTAPQASQVGLGDGGDHRADTKGLRAGLPREKPGEQTQVGMQGKTSLGLSVQTILWPRSLLGGHSEGDLSPGARPPALVPATQGN